MEDLRVAKSTNYRILCAFSHNFARDSLLFQSINKTSKAPISSADRAQRRTNLMCHNRGQNRLVNRETVY